MSATNLITMDLHTAFSKRLFTEPRFSAKKPIKTTLYRIPVLGEQLENDGRLKDRVMYSLLDFAPYDAGKRYSGSPRLATAGLDNLCILGRPEFSDTLCVTTDIQSVGKRSLIVEVSLNAKRDVGAKKPKNIPIAKGLVTYVEMDKDKIMPKIESPTLRQSVAMAKVESRKLLQKSEAEIPLEAVSILPEEVLAGETFIPTSFPQDQNPHGTVFGGTLLFALNQTAWEAANRGGDKPILVRQIRTQLYKAATVGQPLKGRAVVTDIWREKGYFMMEVQSELYSHNAPATAEERIGIGYSIYRLKSSPNISLDNTNPFIDRVSLRRKLSRLHRANDSQVQS